MGYSFQTRKQFLRSTIKPGNLDADKIEQEVASVVQNMKDEITYRNEDIRNRNPELRKKIAEVVAAIYRERNLLWTNVRPVI